MAAHLACHDEIPGLGLKTDRPRLNPTIDLKKHTLSPTEGFVLSRVDGRSSYDEICIVSGLGRDETVRILRDLAKARLILAPGQTGAADPVPVRAVGKDHRTTPGPLERLDDGSEVAADELVDWPDGSRELKTRIIRLHRRLRQLSARELLGVEADADKATVKRAFAAASKELHPDRYFGKNLGSFKAKLAAIFVCMNEASQEIERSRKAASDPA